MLLEDADKLTYSRVNNDIIVYNAAAYVDKLKEGKKFCETLMKDVIWVSVVNKYYTCVSQVLLSMSWQLELRRILISLWINKCSNPYVSPQYKGEE